MSALLARASVAQSLVRTVGKTKTPASSRLSELFKADAAVQAIMKMPPIVWVDEKPFLSLLGVTLQHLGENAYVDSVHAASLAMLKHGIFRAAQVAFTLFKKPGIPAYAMWAQRMWSLSFQGLKLTYEGEDAVEGVKMILTDAPAGGFTRPLVLGTCGVVQTVFTFAKLPGRARVLPHQTGDAAVHLRLRADVK